jgi:hypothetical protein
VYARVGTLAEQLLVCDGDPRHGGCHYFDRNARPSSRVMCANGGSSRTHPEKWLVHSVVSFDPSQLSAPSSSISATQAAFLAILPSIWIYSIHLIAWCFGRDTMVVDDLSAGWSVALSTTGNYFTSRRVIFHRRKATNRIGCARTSAFGCAFGKEASNEVATAR